MTVKGKSGSDHSSRHSHANGVGMEASGGGAEARGGGWSANEGGVAKRTANLFVSDKDSLYYMEYAD